MEFSTKDFDSVVARSMAGFEQHMRKDMDKTNNKIKESFQTCDRECQRLEQDTKHRHEKRLKEFTNYFHANPTDTSKALMPMQAQLEQLVISLGCKLSALANEMDSDKMQITADEMAKKTEEESNQLATWRQEAGSDFQKEAEELAEKRQTETQVEHTVQAWKAILSDN